MLPPPVLRRARDELLDYAGTGMSVMEMSHRGAVFQDIASEAERRLRRLMQLGDEHAVLFLQGGAQLQFCAVPMNLMGAAGSADYVDSGIWSGKAIEEARRYGNVNVVASTAGSGYDRVPEESRWRRDAAAAYLHYTPNETIGGVAFDHVPEAGDAPLVADASSMLLSEPLPADRFGLIYAGAQKNMGIAGLTLVVVRRDLLDRACASIPTLLRYDLQVRQGSMANTAPTFAWYMAGLVLEWLEDCGGVSAMARRNRDKAGVLYDCIDASAFYECPVLPDSRSRMNVIFRLAEPALEEAFLEHAESAGLRGLKGHRSVGGVRASLYNAMPIEGVQALVDVMRDFERRRA
jgi:phosphoserine aminotransferase